MTTLSPIAKRFLTLSEASVYSGLSYQSLRRMIDRQELKGCRPLGTRPVLIDRHELDKRILGDGEEPTPAA